MKFLSFAKSFLIFRRKLQQDKDFKLAEMIFLRKVLLQGFWRKKN